MHYKNLETLIVLSEELQEIGDTRFFDSTKLKTIILCAITPPNIAQSCFKEGLTFYVPDDSLYLYQTTYPNYGLNFLPISEYSGDFDLLELNIEKLGWNFEINRISPAWYYYDVSTWNSCDIVLTNGCFHSEIFPVTNKNHYLSFTYKQNTIICDLKNSLQNDKPAISPEPGDHCSRIYVYTETPLKIICHRWISENNRISRLRYEKNKLKCNYQRSKL